VTRWSWRPAHRPSTWACPPKKPSWAAACRAAPPAMVSSTATSPWRWSAAATRPSKKRCIFPTSPARSPWYTAGTSSRPSPSWWTSSTRRSLPARSSSSCSTPWTRCWATPPAW